MGCACESWCISLGGARIARRIQRVVRVPICCGAMDDERVVARGCNYSWKGRGAERVAVGTVLSSPRHPSPYPQGGWEHQTLERSQFTAAP